MNYHSAGVTMFGVTVEFYALSAIEYLRSLMIAYSEVQPTTQEEWIRLAVIHASGLPYSKSSIHAKHWWDLPTHLRIQQASHNYKHQQFVGSKERP